MSGQITAQPGDRGLIWVFAVELDDAQVKAFTARNGSWPVQTALGVDMLDPDHVEVFPVKDLEGLGLSGYLEQGMGVPEDQLRDTRPLLDGVKGWVLVLSSKAFDGVGQSFTPRAPLRLVASFSEDRPPVQFDPLPSEAATGTLSGTTAAPAPRKARGWTGPVILLVVAVALICLAVVLS